MELDRLIAWERELSAEIDRLRQKLDVKLEEFRHVERLRQLKETSSGRQRRFGVIPRMRALLEGASGGNGRVPWNEEEGAKMKERRLRHGLSLAKVGRAVGVTGSRIFEIEKARASGGRRTAPSPALLERLMTLYQRLETERETAKSTEAS
jgi:DNA-binding XRE family transcriptional regulator